MRLSLLIIAQTTINYIHVYERCIYSIAFVAETSLVAPWPAIYNCILYRFSAYVDVANQFYFSALSKTSVILIRFKRFKAVKSVVQTCHFI